MYSWPAKIYIAASLAFAASGWLCVLYTAWLMLGWAIEASIR